MDIGTLTGAIAIEDQFSSVMDLAARKVEDFAGKFGESSLAIVEGAGIVVGAISGITAAIVTLASKGADVNDVSSTLDHFAESAGGAEAVLDGLRQGVRGTVGDMDLMRDASRVLSAGARINADDLRTMGEAAFVLQNRGLGGTAEMLNMISDAMVTGRTRTLAMKLGVVDAADAEQDYADKLGIAKSELTQTQSAEARRQAVLQMLRGAVKDAGDQQLDFGEKIERVEASMGNWMERLESTVAESPAVTRAIDAITGGIDRLGGGDAVMDAVTGAIDRFADMITFAEPYVEEIAGGIMKFFGAMKSGFDTISAASDWWEVLALRAQGYSKAEAEAIVASENEARAQAEATKAAQGHAKASVELTQEQKAEKEAAEAAAASHKAYEQTVQGVIDSVRKANRDAGAFAEAFDKLGAAQKFTADAQAIIIPQLDALVAKGKALTDSQKVYYAMVTAGVENLRAEGEAKIQSNKVTLEMIEQNLAAGASEAALAAKLGITVEALKNYQTAATQLRDVKQDINRLELEWSGHLADQVEADRARELTAITNTFTGTKEQLAELLDATNQKYDLIKKTGTEAWKSIENESISAKLQQIRDQEELVVHMEASGNFFRADIDKQREKLQQMKDDFRGLGQIAGEEVPKKMEVTFNSLFEAMAATDRGIDAATIKVRDLNGTVVSLTEAIAKLNNVTIQQTYDLSTKQGIDQFRRANTDAQIFWSDEQIMAFAKIGGTLQQLVNRGVIKLNGISPTGGDLGPDFDPYARPTSPGSPVTIASSSLGASTVPPSVSTPTGSPMAPPGGFGPRGIPNVPVASVPNIPATGNNFIFYVNGTAEETARKIGKILTDEFLLKNKMPFTRTLR